MRVVVVGYGHADHGEDAAGLLVVEAIRTAEIPNVETRAVTGEAMRVIEAWDCCDTAIVVETVDTGRLPGTVFRMNGPRAAEDAVALLTSPNTVGLCEAFERSSLLGRVPSQLIFYGIEGHECAPGAKIGPEVLAAVSNVVARIKNDLAGLFPSAAGASR